jgi:hypothetical protein
MLRVFENNLLRRMFGPMEEFGDKYVMGNFIIYSFHLILLELLNQRR